MRHSCQNPHQTTSMIDYLRGRCNPIFQRHFYKLLPQYFWTKWIFRLNRWPWQVVVNTELWAQHFFLEAKKSCWPWEHNYSHKTIIVVLMHLSVGHSMHSIQLLHSLLLKTIRLATDSRMISLIFKPTVNLLHLLLSAELNWFGQLS